MACFTFLLLTVWGGGGVLIFVLLIELGLFLFFCGSERTPTTG